MFVRTIPKPNGKTSIQIVESARRGKKVRQKIIRHVGVAHSDVELRELLRLAEYIKLKMIEETTGSLFPPEVLIDTLSDKVSVGRPRKTKKTPLPIEQVILKNLAEESRVIQGIQDVFGSLFDDLGFDKIMANKGESLILKSTVLARIANPVSKLKTASLLEEDFGISIPLQKIYRMMDSLYDRKDQMLSTVFSATSSIFEQKLDIVFFDVTTLYFESFKPDDLRNFGFSKDQKFHNTQVVLALATTQEGLPIGYKLFPGNTADVSTLSACVKEWKTKVKIKKVLLIGDRGMLSKKNISILEEEKFEYIVAAKIRSMNGEIKKQVLQESGYKVCQLNETGELYWIKELTVNGSRLIVSFNSRRARKDASDRARILEKIEKKILKGKKGSSKKLVSNSGYKKYVKIQDSVATINPESVAEDTKWDGIHGVVTNSDLAPRTALKRYRELWTIEDSFRVSKHDLKMRPIFHFTPKRIEAHVAVCFIAYALIRHTQYRVRLQQKEKLSPERLRSELVKVQASILRDKTTEGLYGLPSNMSQTAVKIYRAMGLRRSMTPCQISV